MKLHALAVALVAGILVSCAGNPPTTPSVPAGSDPKLVWSDSMAMGDKVSLMKGPVMSKMTPVFQASDASKYAAFSCATCHGPNKGDPKAFLPHLTMKDGQITSFAEKADASKFMAAKVVPAMAEAMGLAPYDPATKQGFGCGGCHAIDMK